MGLLDKPPKVRDAIEADDSEALSAMGRSGGKKSAQRREENKIFRSWRPGSTFEEDPCYTEDPEADDDS